jgi:RHS repeat-associated protein
MTDSKGNIIWQADYDPFGGLVTLSGTEVNNFRFPGQYFDSETGLHYNWHRYYDPETGRYLRPDPIGLEGGMNLYMYVNGNPVSSFDFLGLDTTGCDIGPFKFIESPCVLECCAAHDKCYDEDNCAANSWVWNPTGECYDCNDTVTQCIIKCLGKKSDDPFKPNYYCAKQHKYIDIPGDFQNIKTAEIACKTR